LRTANTDWYELERTETGYRPRTGSQADPVSALIVFVVLISGTAGSLLAEVTANPSGRWFPPLSSVLEPNSCRIPIFLHFSQLREGVFDLRLQLP
jgi:hypothetical protein